jgi:hypothetical protein
LLYWKWLRDTFYSTQTAQSKDSDPGVRAAAAKSIQMITNMIASADKSFQTDPQGGSGGRVISVP